MSKMNNVILFMVVIVTGWSMSAGHVCKRIHVVPMCRGIGYNYTFMPNTFNHDSQAEVALEIHQYWPLVQIGCSSSLRKFLCSVYTPICTKTGGTMLPCRSLCKESQRGCAPLMRKYGFNWPAQFNCSSFPVEGGNTSCIAPDARHVSQTTDPITTTDPTTTTDPITTTDPTTTASPSRTRGVQPTRASKCEKITIPLCKGVPYNQTMLPNRFGHRTQKQAALEFRLYSPLVAYGSHKYVQLFFCSLYAPVCTVLETPLPPCRSLCERTKKWSVPVLDEFGLSWPDKFNCSNFPDFGDKICISSTEDESDITATSRPTAETVILPPRKFRTLLTKVQAVFASPNYPNPYPQGIECKWIIQLPDSYKVVKITIKKMRLEEDRNCLYDYIIIKDKMLNQVGPRHCGTYPSPYQVLVRGNKAIITFVSDGNTSKAGFVIKYKGLQNDSNSA